MNKIIIIKKKNISTYRLQQYSYIFLEKKKVVWSLQCFRVKRKKATRIAWIHFVSFSYLTSLTISIPFFVFFIFIFFSLFYCIFVVKGCVDDRAKRCKYVYVFIRVVLLKFDLKNCNFFLRYFLFILCFFQNPLNRLKTQTVNTLVKLIATFDQVEFSSYFFFCFVPINVCLC